MGSACSTQDLCALPSFSIAVVSLVVALSALSGVYFGYRQYVLSQEANALTRSMIPNAELFVHVVERAKEDAPDEDGKPTTSFQIRLCNAGSMAARVRRMKVLVPDVHTQDKFEEFVVSEARFVPAFVAFCNRRGIELKEENGDPCGEECLSSALKGTMWTYVIPANASADHGFTTLLRVRESWLDILPLSALQRFAKECVLEVELYVHTDLSPGTKTYVDQVRLPLDGSFPDEDRYWVRRLSF